MIVDKACFHDATQLLQEIDRKMSIMAFILQQISRNETKEEVSPLFLISQQRPKMTPLAKRLSLQPKNIQEQYNPLFCREDVRHQLSE